MLHKQGEKRVPFGRVDYTQPPWGSLMLSNITPGHAVRAIPNQFLDFCYCYILLLQTCAHCSTRSLQDFLTQSQQPFEGTDLSVLG